MSDAAAARANPRRAFIRHTAGVPIEVAAVPGGAGAAARSLDVSVGGLAFLADDDIPVGTTIQVRIPVDPPFEALARVAWTLPEDDGFCIGAQFLDADDAFRARMVEQVCSIDRYRRQVAAGEGRILSDQEAAAEWISRYAGRFPDH